MKPQLYLHIGTNKTGSSAIQRFFSLHREALLGEGLLYPLTGCDGGAHYGLSRLLGFEHKGKAAVDLEGIAPLATRHALQQELEQAPQVKRLVVSSENFVLPRDTTPVRDFFADFEVKVVVYLRRHDHWFPSAYNQAVRMVANPPWEKSLAGYVRYQQKHNPSYGNYRQLLQRWADVFGKENILVRPYERQQNRPNIIADFLHTICCGELEAFSLSGSEAVNDSVDSYTLNLIDAYQRAQLDDELRRRLIQRAIDNRRQGGKPTVAPSLLLRLVRRNQADYQFIAREYLGRADGRLFYEPLPDPQLPWSRPSKPTPNEIVEAVVAGISDFCQQRVLQGE